MEYVLGIGLLGMGLYIYASVIFAAGMASKGLRLAKKQILFFLVIHSSLTGIFKSPIVIRDGRPIGPD